MEPRETWPSRDHKTDCLPKVKVNKHFVIYQLSKKNKKPLLKNFFLLFKPVFCEPLKLDWITMINFFRILYLQVTSLLLTSLYLALFFFKIYAPSYCFSCSTIFILICDERAKVFPLQPRSNKVTKLNSLPVLLLLIDNIIYCCPLST